MMAARVCWFRSLRIVLHPGLGGRDAHLLEELHGPTQRDLRRHLLVGLHRLFDLETDREHGIEAAQRVLEDHGDVLATDIAHVILRHGHDV